MINSRLRASDILARYGGEEFIVLLPEADLETSLNIAEEIRKLVEEHPFSGEESQPLGKLTVSIGSSTFAADGGDGSTLLEVADRRLYPAKQNGRNKICCS